MRRATARPLLVTALLGFVLTGRSDAVPSKAILAKCQKLLNACLEKPWQPPWNQGTYGPKKDCGACYRACTQNNGNWPDVKCPQ